MTEERRTVDIELDLTGKELFDTVTIPRQKGDWMQRGARAFEGVDVFVWDQHSARTFLAIPSRIRLGDVRFWLSEEVER